jgi:hypothetical protein
MADLTRRQREVLKLLQSGAEIMAVYQGGPGPDMDNWDFFFRTGDGFGCAPSARALIAAGLVRIAAPTPLGYYFLEPTNG